MTLSSRTALVGLLLCAVATACGPRSAGPAQAAAMPEYPPPLVLHRNAPMAATAPVQVRSHSLAGLVIKLIHTARRAGDARAAAVRLRELGAHVELAETSDSGNEPHTGKAYFYEGFREQAAAISAVIADIEEVVPAPTDGASPDLGQQINLWIVHVNP